MFRINYHNNNEVYEMYARTVNTNELLGFVTLGELVFDVSSNLVIDPTEERLKNEFNDVKKLHLPLQNVLKIEEVEQKKSCKIMTLNKEGKMIAIQPGSK